jgi:hypothetical protein
MRVTCFTFSCIYGPRYDDSSEFKTFPSVESNFCIFHVQRKYSFFAWQIGLDGIALIVVNFQLNVASAAGGCRAT